MPRHSQGHARRSPLRGGPDPRRLRLLALTSIVACAVVLPFAVASAGQTGAPERAAGRPAGPAAGPAAGDAPARPGVRPGPLGDDKMPRVTPGRSPLLLGLGPATAARCGPEVSSPYGVEAQTCVMTQGEDAWARTYYRNATGGPLDAALTLMGPGDRTVRMRCAPDGDDEPVTCETPRERLRGMPAVYTAVAEFARRGDRGPLLLRSGSGGGAAEGAGETGGARGSGRAGTGGAEAADGGEGSAAEGAVGAANPWVETGG
ncbi:hypothetical protein [Streptomyces sp. NPDC004065]|uniref:hypothetical protein n=1 Tax=Streptomyces sp. NPDC004065 TaxID=3364689 RepID=UPI00384CE04B